MRSHFTVFSTSILLLILTLGSRAAWPAGKPYVVLRRGDVTAVIVNNDAVDDDILPGHRAGYSGLASLTHRRQNRNLFVPAYAGLNFEHIHDGTVQPRDILFEPRRAPMEIRRTDDDTAQLHQPPTPHWQLESWLRYELLPDGAIELTLECIPRAHTFKNDYIGLFFASYIHQPESLDIHFLGQPADSPPAAPQWIRGVTPAHGTLPTHLALHDDRVFAHDADFPLTLVFNRSHYHYHEPWYYGLSHNMAFAQMFRPADQVRISQSPSGGGQGNPAWDFQWFIPQYEVGHRYRFVMRALFLPFASPDQITAATAPHRTALQAEPDALSEAVTWLEAEAHRLIRASKRTMADGTAAFPPQVGLGYEAFWLRDYEYTLEGSIASYSDKELTDACRLFVRKMRADGAGTDCVKFDGTPVYKPGFGTMGTHPVADGSQFTVAVAWHTYRRTQDARLLREIIDPLIKTMNAVPRDPDTALVHIKPGEPQDRCPYGFTDTIRKQGDVLFCSLLYVQASRQLADLLDALGREEEAQHWRDVGRRVASSVRTTFWDSQVGLFRAATVQCREHDIWGSAFAVYLGVADSQQAKAIATYFQKHYAEIVQAGQIRHLPGGTYWEKAVAARDTYQNGAYWATPTGWFVYTLDLVDPALADRTVLDMARHFQTHGACEWIFGDQRRLPHYLASAALPLAGIRAVVERRNTSPAKPLSAAEIFENRWNISAPILSPGPRGSLDEVAVKDPSLVFVDGMWHLFYTARSETDYTTGYVAAKKLTDLRSAPRHELKMIRGKTRYGCAPQVFYYEPQHRWYLIFQSRDANYQPAFSTTTTITDPNSWTEPVPLLNKDTEAKWIDFWVICDETNAYLFYTQAHHDVIVRSTGLEDFPNHWSAGKTVFDNVHEAVHIYKARDRREFHLIYELNEAGLRSFGLATAESLTGPWQKITDRYATGDQLRPTDPTNIWAEMVSHGEALRTGYNQRMEYDPNNTRWLIQAIRKDQLKDPYPTLPWQLGIITKIE